MLKLQKTREHEAVVIAQVVNQCYQDKFRTTTQEH